MKENEASEIVDEITSISKEDAYSILITQKLQQYIDQKTLTKAYPDFIIETGQDRIFLEDSAVVKKVELIEPFVVISDSVKTVKTKVTFESKIDTLTTIIKTSDIKMDGEIFKTTKVIFETVEKPNISNQNSPKIKDPKHVARFTIRDLSFTWEEINACDCLFMVNAINTPYKKLYFGRFKDNQNGILQLGKNTTKYVIPIKNPRSKVRKPGSFWTETYQNDDYQIRLKASKATPKVKNKYTYYIDFTFTELSSKKTIRNLVLANCKS
ncbi:hypothetical protein GCM10022259_29560 [Aquimarina mytili]